MILVAPVTNAVFVSLRRPDKKKRSTMDNNRLNHLMVERVYQEKFDKTNIFKVAIKLEKIGYTKKN